MGWENTFWLIMFYLHKCSPTKCNKKTRQKGQSVDESTGTAAPVDVFNKY